VKVTPRSPSNPRISGVNEGRRRGGEALPNRGELEWIDAGVYRSVTVPDADLSTAVRIARSLL
jgi:hypothetical protein